MQPPPTLAATPGKVHFLRGSTLNELVAAMRARTPLAGTRIATGPPITQPARYDPGKVYRCPPAFWKQMEAALASREPTAAASRNPSGFTVGKGASIAPSPPIGSSAEGLNALSARLHAATPRQPSFRGPQGYRLRTGGEATTLQIFKSTRAAYGQVQCINQNHPDDGPTEGDYGQLLTSFFCTIATERAWDNGSYVETYTATGDFLTQNHLAGPFGSPPSPAFSTTQDGGFAYGGFISDTPTLGGWLTLAALEPDLVTELNTAPWPGDTLLATLLNAGMGSTLETYVSSTGVWGTGPNIQQSRFRIRNSGSADIDLVTSWLSDGVPIADSLRPIRLSPGASSPWLTSPQSLPSAENPVIHLQLDC